MNKKPLVGWYTEPKQVNKVLKGSFWKCIDRGADEYGRMCVVKYINDHPGFNGDGTIQLLYADGSMLYTKVRRFMPGITHRLVRQPKGHTPHITTNALAQMEEEVLLSLYRQIKLLAGTEPKGLSAVSINIELRKPGLMVLLAAAELGERRSESDRLKKEDEEWGRRNDELNNLLDPNT